MKQASVITALGLVLLAVGLTVAACSPGGKYPIPAIEDGVVRGSVIYVQECASCHGDRVIRPPVPAAPTHQADGHTWHHPDRLLVQWVLDGVPNATLMPKFRGQLTEDEARAVIEFIKTFWPEQVRERQEQGSVDYERQLAEDGG